MHLRRRGEGFVYFFLAAVLLVLVLGITSSHGGQETPEQQLQQGGGESLAAAARARSLEYHRSLGLPFIMVIGLIDGINPCAFTTLVFFISYLTLVGRKGKDVLIVGGAFSVAIFLTYLSIGFGLLAFVNQLRGVKGIAPVVDASVAGVAVFLGALSIRDYFKARKGNISEMTLVLPSFLKRKIQKSISSRFRVGGYAATAFVAGAIVSVLELACTGQMYLPTIAFVAKMAGFRLWTILYMLIYNVMFILPLIGVLLLAYAGISSEKIASLARRNLATSKLLLALAFFALGGVLFYLSFGCKPCRG